jgi:hypothetical protein
VVWAIAWGLVKNKIEKLQLIGQVPWLTSVILVTRKTELRKISI